MICIAAAARPILLICKAKDRQNPKDMSITKIMIIISIMAIMKGTHITKDMAIPTSRSMKTPVWRPCCAPADIGCIMACPAGLTAARRNCFRS